MKTIIIIETVDELLKFANPHRTEGEDTPFLGTKAKLIFENNFETIRIEGADGFELSELIIFEDLLKTLLIKNNIGIHIT